MGFLNLGIDLFLFAVQSVPYPILHNLQKSENLKKIFWHVALEGIDGDYFEFGVASGNSLRAAELASRFSGSRALGVKNIQRRFFGFDSFESFISPDPNDAHHTWEGTNFSFEFSRVAKRFRWSRNVHLLKVDVNSIHLSEEVAAFSQEVIGDRKAAVVMFDMDLKAPTLAALRWISDRLQPGTVLVFDEFFSFSGSDTLGECGAFRLFLEECPMTIREFAAYGDGGRAFQIVSIGATD